MPSIYFQLQYAFVYRPKQDEFIIQFAVGPRPQSAAKRVASKACKLIPIGAIME